MAANIAAIAQGLGAEVVGTVPDCGGGAYGAARLAAAVSSGRAETAARGPGADPKRDLSIRRVLDLLHRIEVRTEMTDVPEVRAAVRECIAELEAA